uniref:Uncharacterized protein n=1 Tax=Physcomitrium patens TaxID=3218 RepID=A0A2K1IHW5_PHYPA|nr:hypothetical protein PHYPA_027561 [Physcomitrium patens]
MKFGAQNSDGFFHVKLRACLIQQQILPQSRHRNCRVRHLLTRDTNQLEKIKL